MAHKDTYKKTGNGTTSHKIPYVTYKPMEAYIIL